MVVSNMGHCWPSGSDERISSFRAYIRIVSYRHGGCLLVTQIIREFKLYASLGENIGSESTRIMITAMPSILSQPPIVVFG